MPTLGGLMDVRTWLDLAVWLVGFIAWSLALWAIASALWRSFPAQEFHAWLWRDPAKSARLDRLRWEIEHGMHYDEEVARGQTLIQGRPLSPDEVAERRQEFAALARISIGKRAVSFFLGCALCQHFWTAVVMVGVTRPASADDLLVSAFAYAAVASIAFMPLTQAASKPKKAGGCAGGGCGGHG